MSRDIDLLRVLLLELERQQRSPPEPIFVELDELTRVLARSMTELVDALELLTALNFIEGPGEYHRKWLFRRLTRRGQALADAVRNPADWRDVKDQYAPMLRP